MDEEYGHEASNIVDMLDYTHQNENSTTYSRRELNNVNLKYLAEAFDDIYEENEYKIIEINNRFIIVNIKGFNYMIEIENEFYKIVKL